MTIVKQNCTAHSLQTSHPVTAEQFDVSEARTDHRTRGQESWPMSLCQEQFSWLLSACLGFLWLPPVRGSLTSWLCAIACIASWDPWKGRLPPDSGWEDAFSSHGQMLITLGWFSGRSVSKLWLSVTWLLVLKMLCWAQSFRELKVFIQHVPNPCYVPDFFISLICSV